MATFNGRRWIDEQIDSIMVQSGVDLRVRISDDGSDDGTREHLQRRAARDPRIEILPRREGAPGVTANFLHLFRTWNPTEDVFVAFSDQDDVWHPDKLETQIAGLRSRSVDAVSSNVTSFDSRGRRHLIIKSQPQVQWDHIFEAAGPGSTYVFTPQLHRRLLRTLDDVDTGTIGVHDWLLYALTRAIGGHWHIDAAPTVDYRQHGANVQGENFGPRALCSRFRRLRSGFYREQFVLIADAVRRVNVGVSESDLADLDRLRRDLRDRSIRGRASIARRWRQIRRERILGFQLGLACLLGIW